MRSYFRLAAATLSLSVAGFAACTDSSSESPALPDAGTVPLDASATSDGNVGVDATAPDVVTHDAAADTDATATDATASDATTDDATTDATASDGAVDAGPDAPTTGEALSFDGADDLVTMSVDPSETAFTAELWFKMAPAGDAGFAAEGNMFEVYSAGGGADRFLFVHLGKACFYVYNPGQGNPQFCSTTLVNDGAWHHVAGTVGVVSGTRFYLDGVEVGGTSKNTLSTFSGGNLVRLGYGHFGFSSGFIRMQGAIDEVRLWNVERSAAEIAANKNAAIAPGTAGLQAYWSLDESVTSNVAHDSALLADGGPAKNDGILSGFTLDAGPSPWILPGAL